MAKLFLLTKGDDFVKCEEGQISRFEAQGYKLKQSDLDPVPTPDFVPPGRGLVGMIKDGDTIYCEREQVGRFVELGYKERDPYEQLEDLEGGASSPERSEAPAEGSGSDLGRPGSDAQPASEAGAPDELPEDGSPEGDVVEKTPEQLVREAYLGQIREVLGGLDFDDDKLWAKHGAPLITVVEKRLGKDVTRDDIDEAWPGFARGS